MLFHRWTIKCASFSRSPTFLDTEQVQPRSPYAPSPKKPLYSPKDGHIFQNGNPHVSTLSLTPWRFPLTGLPFCSASSAHARLSTYIPSAGYLERFTATASVSLSGHHPSTAHRSSLVAQSGQNLSNAVPAGQHQRLRQSPHRIHSGPEFLPHHALTVHGRASSHIRLSKQEFTSNPTGSVA